MKFLKHLKDKFGDLLRTRQQSDHIVNYFEGATIHNIVINGTMSRQGDEHYYSKETMAENSYSDEQVAAAIEAICGDGKPLDTKQKWAAVYWYLRWQCNYPVKGSEFCERIEHLPFTKKPEPMCSYENIRKLLTLSFMNQAAQQAQLNGQTTADWTPEKEEEEEETNP